MAIRRRRSLRALAVRNRAEAAEAADRAARALASIEAEIVSIRGEMIAAEAVGRALATGSRSAALLEADALHRSSRLERRRAFASRLEKLESEARRGRADLDAAKEELARAIRAVEALKSH